MKKLVNRPESVVAEMVEGLTAVYPGMTSVPGHTVLVQSDLTALADRPVAVISGGGSGHEPAHAGYVGRGMLSAAVAGDVFTSPSPDAVLAAIRASAGPRGALLIVKNYTGDRLNFGVAAEQARAEGIPVEMALVADDVALASSVDTAGRRGLAGTILVHKIAGAAAAEGASLADVAALARATAAAVRTMGVALTPCTVPAAGKPGFLLHDTEIELGLGIHGEPGVRRESIAPADSIVDRLLDAIVADLVSDRGQPVVLLVNNLGGTPTMELAIVARRAIANLEGRGLAVERVYMGTFLSALEMAGVSLTVLPVDHACLRRLDAATDAPAWPNAAHHPRRRSVTASESPIDSAVTVLPPPTTRIGRSLEAAIRTVAHALIEATPRLTELDQAVGDGDLGISLQRGARAAIEALPTYPLDNLAATLHALAVTLQRSLGGTSGPLYAAGLLRASTRLRESPPDAPQTWAAAFQAGCQAIMDLGGAKPGDRTMLDALCPAADAFEASLRQDPSLTTAFTAAANAAKTGTQQTATMAPRRGRSSYLGDRVAGHIDSGAEAVAIWLAALAKIV